MQYNLISTIQNIEFLTSLEYLSLEGNNLSTVSGLKRLFNLLYLNLANNKIAVLDYAEIPKGISILKLGGNPFTNDLSYREGIILHFEQLDELDNISVTEERFRLAGIDFTSHRNDLESIERESELTEDTRPDTSRAIQNENERFMTEDEELQFSKITETAWEAVQKSRQRMEEMHKLRLDFDGKLPHHK